MPCARQLEQTKKAGATYFEQVTKILDADKTEITYNSQWLSKMDFQDIKMLQSLINEIPMRYIRGNTDFYNDVSSEKLITIEDKRIFMTHGHKYSVKRDEKKVIKKGFSKKADIILFGHTHIPFISFLNGVWIINPGSISNRYKRVKNASFARINICDDKIDCEVVEI